MNKKKVNALEIICRNVLEQGMDPEKSLAEFPEYTDELRPLLQMAMEAKAIAPAAVPGDVAQRNRARILAQAAQMRETASVPRRSTLFSFQRVAVPMIMALAIFFSSAALIQASASALPGDNLYAIKRNWENTQIWFVNDEKAANLRSQYEEERRKETKALLSYRHVAVVRFEGIILSQSGNLWNVAGVPVDISADTEVGENIFVGSDVIVDGETQEVGVVLATNIVLSHPEDEDDAILIPATMTEEAMEPNDEEEVPSEILDGDSEIDPSESDEDELENEETPISDADDESDNEEKSSSETRDEPKNDGTSSSDTDEGTSTPTSDSSDESKDDGTPSSDTEEETSTPDASGDLDDDDDDLE